MRKITSALLLTLFCTTAAFAGSAGFKDNGNGTVTDLTTNLMWQQCSAGQSVPGCAGTAATYTWDSGTPSALSYCQNLTLGGYSDWRMPKIKELQSIVDMTKSSGATINTTYFPNTQSSDYWSSTTYAPNTSGAWIVNFSQGYTNGDYKTNASYVRCVRGGQ